VTAATTMGARRDALAKDGFRQVNRARARARLDLVGRVRLLRGSVHAPATSRRCQRSASGLTKKHDQRSRGSTRLTAGEQGAFGGLQPRSWNLAVEHEELVAKYQDLETLGRHRCA
jgi:hypothetical protein